ncbi:MAG: ATP-binding protein [Candidatus Micrarchaeota archaeon]|nr:ATP-binding protein [Candidatus Micrarchaeota archaeon]
MTQVKLQQLMSNEIAKRAFLSRPPEPPANMLMNDPLQAIYIGSTKIFEVPFSWSFSNLTNPHIAVVGITGSGKSYFVKTLLVRASYIWNSNAIIVDFAGEYKNWVKQSGGIVVALGKGDYINIMDLSGMKPIDRTKQIVSSLEILTDISSFPEQRRITEEAIEQSYVNYGFVPSERPQMGKEGPTLKDVIALLQEKVQEGTYEYPAELENAIYRLRQFAREGEDFFARKSTVDIGKLANSGLVALDLSALPDERFRALAALFILQTMKEIMRSEGWSELKGLKTIVVLDEAWKVASDDRSEAITIVREGRKYQFGLIVASQNPTDVNEAIFSNVGTTFILRIKFEKFMNYLQSSLNFSPFIRTEISKFGVGQAAVDMAFQTSLRFPEIFLLEKVYGEEPLSIYTIDVTGVLTESELGSQVVDKEYQMEKEELRNKLVEYNLTAEEIEKVFSSMEQNGRRMKVDTLVRMLKEGGISVSNIVMFLKNMGVEDQVITRIMA